MTEPLAPEALYRPCDTGALDFETTDELVDLGAAVGQDRALDAVRFGTGIRHHGYNLFVLGPRGSGKHSVVRRMLEARAAGEPVPDDWCYVYNFDQPAQPRLLSLPAGRAAALRRDLDRLVEELASAVPAVFESEEYQARLQDMQSSLQQRQQAAFAEVEREAERRNVALLHTPSGFTFAPRDGDEVMDPEKFRGLDEAERQRWQETIGELQERLRKVLLQMPQWLRAQRQDVKTLNQEMAEFAVGPLIRELQDRYAPHAEVVAHLDAVRHDVIENVEAFRAQERPAAPFLAGVGQQQAMHAILNRYRVNTLVDNSGREGAPVVYADLPSHQHLVGRVEHQVQNGALLTDFTLLRPGALHEANGGYLVLDARKVLMQPWAWEELKRTLAAGEVRIESIDRVLGLASTVSLQPEPMPLDLKVVLVGDRSLYYLLSAHDPDFPGLFKVQVDFEDDLARDGDSVPLYARFLATLVRRERLQALDRGAVGRIVEHASRLADDGERLTANAEALTDLLREADHWAREAGHEPTTAADVERAIDERIRRADRLRDATYRQIDRGVLLVDVTGTAVGQVNGLAAYDLDDFRFARPTRITANVWAGRGHVIDIEREIELGGAIHSKGVLILSSFLGARFGGERSLSLSASLTFEQSYGPVEGDSASAAELCALLSALAGAPISQALAITGSINQHGRIQAIGAVNEKIEGFFDVCRRQGLTGDQGVLIPASNVPHLMLRADVREAVAEGRFRVHAVRHVDEALALLTGLTVGGPDTNGVFPEGTLNRRVRERLDAFDRARRDNGNGNGNGAGAGD